LHNFDAKIASFLCILTARPGELPISGKAGVKREQGNSLKNLVTISSARHRNPWAVCVCDGCTQYLFIQAELIEKSI